MTVARYSLLRLLLLTGCLLTLKLVGVDDPTLLIILTLVVSVPLSYFVLRGPREAMTRQLSERVSNRLPQDERSGDLDAAAEDEEVANSVSAEREPQPQQNPVPEFGAAGVTQHGDQVQPPSPAQDGSDGPAQ